MNHTKSEKLFTKAKAIIPGGVNSPVRAFKSAGCNPIFIEKAVGSKIYDVDGNEYEAVPKDTSVPRTIKLSSDASKVSFPTASNTTGTPSRPVRARTRAATSSRPYRTT